VPPIEVAKKSFKLWALFVAEVVFAFEEHT